MAELFPSTDVGPSYFVLIVFLALEFLDSYLGTQFLHALSRSVT